MPSTGSGSPVFIAGCGMGPSPMMDFFVPVNQPARYRISGVTKDSAGGVIGLCTVDIFETASRRLIGVTTSDANGNYSLDVTEAVACFGVFYKTNPGDPDIAGTTVNTLVGVP